MPTDLRYLILQGRKPSLKNQAFMSGITLLISANSADSPAKNGHSPTNISPAKQEREEPEVRKAV